ncbi:ABC transporter permease [Aureimonas altamirensis]|uniref:ABC transporter permease n=1 Tax=Aureimonas TaxID=414371 RepID=UPI001785444C|nr:MULTISPECIES: ABC transporter permease [Aureimonas]MCM2504234.1 ABC transporter permease [Aureimonas altamirensis]QOG08704.1 ABC transporter permease [Aureimonas sp. OT7]
MNPYLRFVAGRLLLLFAVIFFGVSAAFFITHLSPIDPVETALGRIINQANFSPDAVEQMRATLTDLYGRDASPVQQYITFWKRVFVGDLGPSIIAFPTPAMTLVWQALPWTFCLLFVSTLITFAIGNILGGMAGYRQNNAILKALGMLAVTLQPIPYYVVAFILLLIFGFVWPVLPISGGFGMNVSPGLNWAFASSVFLHSLLPAISLVLVGFGSWFLGMRALVSNIVTEDYVTYAELAGVRRPRIIRSYVMRNALVPQITGLAMALGTVFSGTIITEQVFNYPGLGSLLIDAVFGGDYSVVLAVSTVSIVAVATTIFIVDLLYPLLDPRIRTE